MNQSYYHAQVILLLDCLPALNKQDIFALKGGTAINFFIQDLPRLSIDIDLTFVKNLPRATAMDAIETGLRTLSRAILRRNKNYRIQELTTREGRLKKLIVSDLHCQIKIEPNFVMRGHLLPTIKRQLKKTVEDRFQFSVKNIPVLAEEELYAGKLCAALSRQHPRDLFDVKLLLEQGGITDEIRQAFVVYLVCQNRPIHELLLPNRLDITKAFQSEFLGMIE